MNKFAPPQTILIVEDSDEDYEAILWAMKKLAAPQKVVRCNDGDDALDFLYRRGKYTGNSIIPRPGLVLLDLNLPGTDGRDVLQQIKLDGRLKTLPIVVLTSSTNPKDIEKCYIEGANSYLRKPVNLDGFTRSLKMVLDYWFGTMERYVEGSISYRTGQMVLAEESLSELHTRIAGLFPRSETRNQVLSYIKALLSTTDRKNCWQLSNMAGDTNPAKMQRLLSHAQWDAEQVRDQLRSYIIEKLGHPQAILVLDEIFFTKKGEKSAGVSRQLNASTGKLENGQVGLFLSYNSPIGNVLMDRELYLPEDWISNNLYRQKTMIPENLNYRSKPEIALPVLSHTLEAGVPFHWLVGSDVYGNSGLMRDWLEERAIPYLLKIDPEKVMWPGRDLKITNRAMDLFVNSIEKTSWKKLKYQRVERGRDTFEWNLMKVERLQQKSGWQTWLLIRRNTLNSKELNYYLVFGHSSISLTDMVRAEEQIWVNEKTWRTANNEVGLDQYEVRFWHGWYRHITLAMAAYIYRVTNQN
jgi:SRSO17 transposase/ActR/RegA family two-component response regulator